MINLGKTDLKIFPVGFGGIPIQRNSEQEAAKLVARAVELGINFFDSARGYTDSERKMGLGLKGLRNKVVLATKTMARTKAEMSKEIETSLRELNTDYIDLYQCHNVRQREEIETLLSPQGGLEALVQAQKEGKIGHIGITGHKPEILLEIMQKFPFATVQFPYNYLEQDKKDDVIRLAKQENMGIIIMKPLAGGAIRKGDLAIRFLLEKDLGVVIPGMDSMEQVVQNANLAIDFKPLNTEELKELDADVKGLGDEFCRRCEYCMPCPEGINIPVMFLLESYYSRYNLPQWALDRYAATDINASACAQCGQCETKCPYSLPIRDKLARVHDLLNRT